MLTKDQILNADDKETEIVSVKGWGGDVLISAMSGSVRDKFEASILGKNGGQNLQNIRAKLVALSVVDESGDLIFSDSDITKLGKKCAKSLDKVFFASKKLNGMTEDDVDELAKN